MAPPPSSPRWPRCSASFTGSDCSRRHRHHGPFVASRALAAAALAQQLHPSACSAAAPAPAKLAENSSSFGAFISATVEHCYGRLAEDQWCCLDAEVAPGVTKMVLSRPGAAWRCTRGNGCWDAYWGGKGDRGEDVLWTPSGASCSSPRILYLHGGSWMFGSPLRYGYDSLASKLASLSGAVVLATDNPLMPLGSYSTIMRDALDALEWLAAHGPNAVACPPYAEAPLFVAGDSSGGGTAASVLLRTYQASIAVGTDDARAGWPRLAGAFLYSPWMNMQCDTPTYYFNTFGETSVEGGAGTIYTGDIIFPDPPRKNRKSYKKTALLYLGKNESLLEDPIASPLFAGPDELRGLPPIFIAVSSTESIAGDSIIFAGKAAQHGVEVHLDVYPGMWHDFPMYSEGCGSGQPLFQAHLALNRTADFVRGVTARSVAMILAGAGSGGDRGRHQDCGTVVPQTSIHYGEPSQRGESWVPPMPLQLHCPGLLNGTASSASAASWARWAEAPAPAPAAGVPERAWRDVVFFGSGAFCWALVALAVRAVRGGEDGGGGHSGDTLPLSWSREAGAEPPGNGDKEGEVFGRPTV